MSKTATANGRHEAVQKAALTNTVISTLIEDRRHVSVADTYRTSLLISAQEAKQTAQNSF